MPRNFRYWGFISYSHADRALAERLHAALERYRVPTRLVGLDGPFGPAPARVHPVFRDRDELNAGGELGATVKTALDASRSLIVICSRDAALSRWVDAEAEAFRQLHPGGPVFCILTGDASIPIEQCIPEALKPLFAAAPGINETTPIAVDLRPGGDGLRKGVQKIVSGLTGLPLDQLVQRDAQRRHRQMAWLAAALAAVSLSMGALVFSAYRSRDEARFQRAQAESMIEFMLVDLRKKLEPHGRLDALEAVGAKALAYYDVQHPDRLDIDSLGRRARALHLIGEIADRRSDVQVARRAFTSARAATAELLSRAPDDPKRLYEHAQSVYWNGYMDWQYGDLESAEHSLKEYAELAGELSKKDAADPEALAEVGYAHSNLGTLLMEKGRARDALREFRESLRIDRQRITLHGNGIGVQLDLGQDRAWLSSAYLAMGQVKPAIAEREAELELYDQLMRQAPDDANIMEAKMFAHHQMGDLAFAAGDLRRARSELERAVSAADANRKLDESGVAWRHSLAGARISLARLARLDGDTSRAVGELRRAQALIDGQLQGDPENPVWRLSLQEYASAERAATWMAAGDESACEAELTRARQRLQDFPEKGAGAYRALRYRVHNAALRAQFEGMKGNAVEMRSALDELVAVAGKDQELDPSSRCYLRIAMVALAARAETLELDACEHGVRRIVADPRGGHGRVTGAHDRIEEH